MKARPLAALVLTLLLAAPSSVHAQATSLSETLSGEAKAEYESARLLYGNGDFSTALLKFSAAHERSRTRGFSGTWPRARRAFDGIRERSRSFAPTSPTRPDSSATVSAPRRTSSSE